MKKLFFGLFLVVILALISINFVYASFWTSFGGRIANTEASIIRTYEDAGYDCLVPGSTMEVWSIYGSTDYFIPSYVTPVTIYKPNINQQILGISGGQTPITCIRDEEEDGGSGFLGIGGGGDDAISYQITVMLDTILYFGTSMY